MKSVETGSVERHPRSVGPYRLEGLLGRGGMGEVYRAYDQRLARWVAVKHIRPEAADRPTARARFKNEAWAAARLSHPAIVPIFDIVEDEEGDWIVLELVEGPTLAEQLEKGPLPLPLALAYVREIAEGLAEAHGKGILHRDLKPENVIVSKSGHARILDFGLAKRLFKVEGESSLSMPGQVLGTCRSMSPEQARGLSIDERSDLFSLGTLLYELVTGCSPFLGATPTDTLARVCAHQQRPIRELKPDLPEGLSALVEQLLQKEPENRPGSSREVADRLADLAAAFPPPRSRVLLGGSGAADTAGEPTLLGTESATLSEPVRPYPGTPLQRTLATARLTGSYLDLPRGRRAFGIGALLLALVALTLLPAAPWRRSPTTTLPATGDSYSLYRQGMSLLERYERKGHMEQALTLFQRALASDGRSAPAHAGLSRVYWRKAQEEHDPVFREQALAIGRRAVELDGQLAVARVSLGLADAALGRYPEATAQLEQARRLDPGNADAWRGLGEVAESQGRREEAAADYQKAIALRPADRELHDLLGALAYKEGRYGEAEAEFRKSIALAPDCVYGYRNLGVVYYSQGRLDEAAKQFQAALEIAPRSSIYNNLGAVLFAQGLYQDAVAAFEKALQGGGAHSYLLWASLADAYRWTPDHQEDARKAYSQALQLLHGELAARPDDPGLGSREALYLAKRGDREQALAKIDQVLPRAAHDGATLFRAAMTYEIAGQRDKALGALDRALRAGYSLDIVRREPELLKLRADPRYQTLALRWPG
jgi:eukaryotic-like serine/threonine-protein kinase